MHLVCIIIVKHNDDDESFEGNIFFLSLLVFMCNQCKYIEVTKDVFMHRVVKDDDIKNIY